MKGAYWWNEEVKEKVNEKKEAYSTFMNNETDEEKRLVELDIRLQKMSPRKLLL